ncbi:MAG: caspase family protein, partial [Acidobacteriota bacterium]
AWRRLSDRARAGDQVLVHYSGHGGRVPTIAPTIKPNGLDETLVPCNITDPSARHLRDIEIAHLLAEMVDRELYVTLVLDCCHAGGATRSGPTPRGGSRVDSTPRPTVSDVATPATLVERWRQAAGSTPRDAILSSGWLPDPRGYVLLAACRAHELAFEQWLPGIGKAGALTHWLLEGLRRAAPRTTYHQLHRRLTAQVRSQLEEQTPQIEGDVHRLLFDRAFAPPRRQTLCVLRVVGDRALLNTGEAQAVQTGDRFTIVTDEAADSPASDAALAEVEIEEVGAVDAWARILRRHRRSSIHAGDRALPHAAAEGGPSPRTHREHHLSRYRELQTLRNADDGSPLAGRLRVSLERLPADYDPTDSPRHLLVNAGSSRLDVAVGDWLCLRIENQARQPFDVTVLDLQPACSVAQIFPQTRDGTSSTLDPDNEILLPLRADLPADLDAGIDTLKVFATLDATDFRWLELPPLGHGSSSQDRPLRSLEPSAYPSRDWTVEQVEVAIVRLEARAGIQSSCIR